MKFFKTEDERSFKELLAVDAADVKQLGKLERELENVRPRWIAIQEKAEALCAQYQCGDRSFTRTTHEPWWKDRQTFLQAEIERLAAERDALTVSVVAAIADVRGRIHRRRSMAGGDFGSWCSVTSSRLQHEGGYGVAGPTELAGALTAARAEINGLSDLGKIFERIEHWLTKIAEIDDSVSLPNIAGIVRRAAE